MLFPRIERKSWFTGFLPFMVVFTFRKYVFIETSTPEVVWGFGMWVVLVA